MKAFCYPAHRYRMLADEEYRQAIEKLKAQGMTDEEAARKVLDQDG